MSWLSRLSVRLKLTLLFACAATALVLVAVISLAGLRSTSMEAQSLITNDFATLSGMSDLRAGIGNLRRYEKDLFLNMAEEAELERYHASWRKELAAAKAVADKLGPRLSGAERAAVDRMETGLATYGKGVNSIVAGIRTGTINDPWAANKAMDPFKGDVRAADKAFGELLSSVNQRVQADAAELTALERRTLLKTAAVAVVLLALTAAVAWMIARQIVLPLQAAGASMRRMAGGDLSETLPVRGGDEIATLVQDIGRMQRSVAGMVVNMRDGIEAVSTASSEIAQGSNDLSTRTESQAASLQQTAASMEQLTSTVRNGADNARQANQLALGASAAAVRGGEVVSQVVQTMSDIQGASGKIAEITGVIDGIAFQTNILALNAAVEAARAGEQGRGFAVVASEVRTLAQHSADAARQIKALIGDSVTKVEAGSQLVQDAGRTIGDVVAQVRRVTDLIGEISAAATEQTQGIDQVGQAVTQLDQTTQQNAALVEESAAAAESLKAQAQRLSESVAVFQLGPQHA